MMVRFNRWLLPLAIAACAEPSMVAAMPAPCCTVSEVRTLRDLTYIARQASLPGDIDARVATLSQSLTAGTSWSDPDRGLVLGYVAATPDGVYWRWLLDSYAQSLGVTIKSISSPVPSPVVVVPPPAPTPTPAPSGDVSALTARIMALEQKVTTLASGSALPSGDVVISGNLTVLGQSSFGGPLKPGVGSAIQGHGRGGFEIIGFSNEAGLDAQNATYVHCGVISVPGNDGGTRIIQGGYWGSDGFVDCDPTRGLNILAFDSLGGLSMSKDDQDGSHERSQDIVFRDYPAQKRWTMTSMRPGWKLCVGWSNTLNAFENTWCPPSPNAVSRGVHLPLPPVTLAEKMGHK